MFSQMELKNRGIEGIETAVTVGRMVIHGEKKRKEIELRESEVYLIVTTKMILYIKCRCRQAGKIRGGTC